MLSPSIAESVRKRAEVHKLVKNDFTKALSIAYSIPEPWYKTQALSNIAEHEVSPKLRLKIILEAFDIAKQCKQPSQIVDVSTWPLRVLIESRFNNEAKEHVQRLLNVLATEPHPVRRGWAMSHMLGVAIFGERENFLNVFHQFVLTCKEAYSWRLDMQCRRLAPVVDQYDSNLTSQLLECIRKPRIQRLAERDVFKYREMH